MQNVLGRITATLVILYPVIAFSIPESAIQTSSLKSGETEQDNADYSRSFDEDQEEKRAWRDLQTAGWGKRGWQNLKTTWGKRTQDWQNLHSSWGKRQGWQKLHGGWGKRGWKDMQSGGWGKRFKDQPNGQWSQFDDNADKYENENPTVLAGKRSWDNFQGSWGKRAADWTSFRGSWGKRSPVDYMNEYSAYADDDDTYNKAYIISPPGYSSYYSSYSPNYPSAESEN